MFDIIRLQRKHQQNREEFIRIRMAQASKLEPTDQQQDRIMQQYKQGRNRFLAAGRLSNNLPEPYGTPAVVSIFQR